MTTIEFVDLKTQQRRILPELERRMKAVLQHGRPGWHSIPVLTLHLKYDRRHLVDEFRRG
jgi:hypothetical protein